MKNKKLNCRLCNNVIDKDAIDIMERLNVKEKHSVCTKCMKNSNCAEPFTIDNIQFI